MISDNYIPVPTVETGRKWPASDHNRYVRDNLAAIYDLARDYGLSKINHSVVGVGGVASVTVNVGTLPSGLYSSLLVFGYARSSEAAASSIVQVQFNSDVGANYDYQRVYINWSSGITTWEYFNQTYILGGRIPGSTAPTNSFGSLRLSLPGATSTFFHKTLLFESSYKESDLVAGSFEALGSGFWRNTAGISTITLSLGTGVFVQGSTFDLFGFV